MEQDYTIIIKLLNECQPIFNEACPDAKMDTESLIKSFQSGNSTDEEKRFMVNVLDKTRIYMKEHKMTGEVLLMIGLSLSQLQIELGEL